MSVYVANRGEIAVRIVRAALEAGHEAVVAVTRAETDSLAARLATGVHVLPGEGAAAYLDAEVLVAGSGAGASMVVTTSIGPASSSPGGRGPEPTPA